MDAKLIGKQLQNRRKKLELTQLQLAEILGVTHQAVSRWETGESIPDIQTLLELSKLYSITIDDIINPNDRIVKVEEITTETEVSSNDYDLFFKLNILLNSIAFIFFMLTVTRIDNWRIGFMLITLLLMTSGFVLNLVTFHFSEKTDNNKKKNNISIMIFSLVFYVLIGYFTFILPIYVLLTFPFVFLWLVILNIIIRYMVFGYTIRLKPIDVLTLTLTGFGLLIYINFYAELTSYFPYSSFIPLDEYLNYNDVMFMMFFGLILFLISSFVMFFEFRDRKHLVVSWISIILFVLFVVIKMLAESLEQNFLADFIFSSNGMILVYSLLILNAIALLVLIVRELYKKRDLFILLSHGTLALFILLFLVSNYTLSYQYYDGNITRLYHVGFNNSDFLLSYLGVIIPVIPSIFLLKKRYNSAVQNF